MGVGGRGRERGGRGRGGNMEGRGGVIKSAVGSGLCPTKGKEGGEAIEGRRKAAANRLRGEGKGGEGGREGG